MGELEKELVPHQEAIELKELGFDEPCFGYYGIENELNIKISSNLDSNLTRRMFVAAPTFSQAFRWFREKYNLRHNITDFVNDENKIEWDYEIAEIGIDLDENGNYKPLIDYSTNDETRQFKSYEEAELACLKKLIEIVKNGKTS